MNRIRDAVRAVRRDDGGFTLVELLMTVFLLGVVVAPLTSILVLHLRSSDKTTARMSESHDARLSASYFGQDVQAVGMRGDYGSTAEPAYVPSIATGAPAGGSFFPCAPAGTPAAVVSLGWDDFADPSDESEFTTHAVYVVQGSELRRFVCQGSTVAGEATLAHHLVAPSAVVTCADAAGAAMSCTGATLPATVTMTLTVRDPDSASVAPYEVTLVGQRRQT